MKLLILALLVSSGMLHAESQNPPPLQTVPKVDLTKYVGKWFEIASIPQPFTKNCFASRATYSLRKDGMLDVLNECQKGSFDGPLKQVKGKAWVVEKKSNAKLKVSFFWPFRGNYWIIELDDNYQWAVVAHPNRKFVWILNRQPTMDEATYAKILSTIEAHNFDLAKIVKTPQR